MPLTNKVSSSSSSTIHTVYNLLHVMLDDNLLLYGPQIVMYYVYVYDAVESGIKQLNWILTDMVFSNRKGVMQPIDLIWYPMHGARLVLTSKN